jgi:hypothetical protein
LAEAAAFELPAHFGGQVLCFVYSALVVALIACSFGAGDGGELFSCVRVEEVVCWGDGGGCTVSVSVAASCVVFEHSKGVAEFAFDDVFGVARDGRYA